VPLDPKWSSVTGPFADNVSGAILAATMREFALELSAALDEAAALPAVSTVGTGRSAQEPPAVEFSSA
jgi:hypothetical protein